MIQVCECLGLHSYEMEQIIILILILHFIAYELLNLAKISNAFSLFGLVFRNSGKFDLDIWKSSKIEDEFDDLQDQVDI